MKKQLLVIGALLATFCIVGLYMRQVTLPMGFGDSGYYLEMAQSPGTFIGSPWGYRIAVPYIAACISSFLGITLKTAYSFLQIGMFSLFLTVMFLWVSRGLRMNTFVTSMACLLFIFSYPGIYNLHNVVHVGLGEHLLVLLGTIAIYHNRFMFLVCIIAVSCLVKESVGMLLIPSYFVLALVFDKWRITLLKTAVLTLVFLLLSLVLRSGILLFDSTDLGTYASFYTWEHVRYVYSYWGGFMGAISNIVGTFGPAWLLALAGFFVAPPRLRALAILPIFAILQIVYATDVSRMVGVGVPVLIAVEAIVFSRIDKVHVAILTSLSCFFFLCFNHRVGVRACFAGSTVLTLMLLWHNRSALTGQATFFRKQKRR